MLISPTFVASHLECSHFLGITDNLGALQATWDPWNSALAHCSSTYGMLASKESFTHIYTEVERAFGSPDIHLMLTPSFWSS